MRRCRVGRGERSLAEMRNYDFFFDLHSPYKRCTDEAGHVQMRKEHKGW